MKLKHPSTDVVPSVTRRPSLIPSPPPFIPPHHPSSLLPACPPSPLLKEPPVKLQHYQRANPTATVHPSPRWHRGLMCWSHSSSSNCHTDRPQATVVEEKSPTMFEEENNKLSDKDARLSPSAKCTNFCFNSHLIKGTLSSRKIRSDSKWPKWKSLVFHFLTWSYKYETAIFT